MFDPNEETAFKRTLLGIVRIFILLIALFASGEFLLGGAFTRFFDGVQANTVEETTSSVLASAHEALTSVESQVSLLGAKVAAQNIPSTIPPAPFIPAAAYIVANVDTGEVYAEKNPDEVRSIASLSKLITALSASGSLKSNPTITISDSARATRGNMAYFSLGESMTLENMMYPLLLNSANDASLAIADYYKSEFFTVMMNKQAREIGMVHSRFVEPSGLSPLNVSTARELLLLARHIQTDKRFIFDITEIEEKTVDSLLSNGSVKSVRYRNIHQLRNIEGFAGGKNGFTSAAGKTLLSLFTIENKSGSEETIVIIVLGSDDSTRDSLSLLSWLKTNL
ncbi:MAG: serine hydrolase [Candidatus Paceibacterota bacterium]